MSIEQNRNPKVSVIIPVYNTGMFLMRCVDSVVNQTYTNIEVILVNDGSNDNSKGIIDHLCDIYSIIVPIHKENGGLSSARNVGKDRSTGDFILFLDSDDFISRDFIDVMIKIQIQYGCDVVSCLSQNVDEYGNLINRVKQDKKIKVFNTKRAINGLKTQKEIRFEVWNKLFKKELIEKIFFKDRQIYEDIYFEREVFFRMNKLVHINKALHYYTINRKGNTNSYFNQRKLNVFEEILDFCIMLKDKGMKSQHKTISLIGMRFAMNLYTDCHKKGIISYEGFLVERYRYFSRESRWFDKIKSPGYLLFSLSPKLYIKSLRFRKLL